MTIEAIEALLVLAGMACAALLAAVVLVARRPSDKTPTLLGQGDLMEMRKRWESRK